MPATKTSTSTKQCTADTAEVLGRRIAHRDSKILKLQRKVKRLERRNEQLNRALDFARD